MMGVGGRRFGGDWGWGGLEGVRTVIMAVLSLNGWWRGGCEFGLVVGEVAWMLEVCVWRLCSSKTFEMKPVKFVNLGST